MKESAETPIVIEQTPKLIGEAPAFQRPIDTAEKFYSSLTVVFAWGMTFAIAFGFGLATRYGLAAIPLLNPMKEYSVCEKSLYRCEPAPEGFKYDVYNNLIPAQ